MKKEPPKRNGVAPVSRWVVLVNYVLCWVAAGYLIAEIIPSQGANPLPYFAAIFLLLFPVSGVPPQEIIRAIVRRGEK